MEGAPREALAKERGVSNEWRASAPWTLGNDDGKAVYQVEMREMAQRRSDPKRLMDVGNTK